MLVFTHTWTTTTRSCHVSHVDERFKLIEPRRRGLEKRRTVYQRGCYWAGKGALFTAVSDLRGLGVMPSGAKIVALDSTTVEIHSIGQECRNKGMPVNWPILWRPDLQDPCDSPFGITGTMSCSVDRQSLRCAAGKPAVEEASATVAAFAYEQGA